MSFPRRPLPLAALVLAGLPAMVHAQGFSGSALPPTPPTQAAAPVSGGATMPVSSASGSIAPLAGVATAADRAGARPHRPQVSCAGGQLAVRADNSSLNSILRAVAQCTGMRITGGVVDQRVFGNYGPAMPATVLATLLDGTGTNVLLRETASDQPAELILTPRTAGPTPPGPDMVANEDVDEGTPSNPSPARPAGMNMSGYGAGPGGATNGGTPTNGVALPSGGTVSGPVSIPQPINNINGSASNTSPTAANYPVTHSVPLDSLPTPSTTPSTTGIVDAPNPPPAGSDTAALLNGRTTNLPGNTTITDQPTSGNMSPAATNTAPVNPAATSGTEANGNPGVAQNPNGSSYSQPAAVPADGTGNGTTGALTPQQVYEQLQKLRQATTPSSTQPQ